MAHSNRLDYPAEVSARNRGQVAPSVAVNLPGWLWGGDPNGFFRRSALVARRDSGAETWRLRTDESYRAVAPDLVSVEEVANPVRGLRRFDRLTQLARNGPVEAEVGLKNPAIAEQYAALTSRVESRPDLVSAIHLWQIQTTLAAPEDLGSFCETVHDLLRNFPKVNDPTTTPFSSAGIIAIRRSDTMGYRTKLISALLRAEHDQRLKLGDRTHLEGAGLKGSVFGSSEGLLSGLAFLDAYLVPLLGALSPAVWAFSAPRIFGTVIYTLGRAVAGTRPDPAELLQVLPSQGAVSRTWSSEGVDGEACFDAVGWWGRRLNELFGVLTDPVVFADAAGFYAPVKHLQALLTVEQLFRRVGSISTSFRDVHAQRVLLFTVLDTVERLTGRPIDQLCLIEQAEKALAALRGSMPEPAGKVLLPLAERAIVALRGLQAGFFMPDYTTGQPMVGDLSLSKAAAAYVKVLRNATHGHGSNQAAKSGRADLLLAHHNGSISHDLAYLGYLYLLELLVRPEVLRARLTASSSRSAIN